MKNAHFGFIIFLLLSSIRGFCQGPQLSYVNGGYIQFKYGCITQQSTYDIEYKVFRVTNLVYDQNYMFETHTSSIFDNTNYEPWPFSFQAVGTYWKWYNQSNTVDTIILHFWGAYSNLNINTSEWLRFGITTVPNPSGSIKDANFSVVTDMVISAPNDPVCSNPITFNLLNMPTSYANATWEIKQGSTVRASGSGTSATANNLSNGSGQVTFTVHFSCGLKDLIFNKDFHFGPYSSSDYPITGPSSATCRTYVYYSIPSNLNYTSINWNWPSSWTYISGQNTTNLALRTGGSGSGGMVMVGVNNSCGQSGSYATKYTSVSGTCLLGLIVSPNPASNEISVTIPSSSSTNPENIPDTTNQLPLTIANVAIKENNFKVIIMDNSGIVYTKVSKNTNTFTLPVQSLRNGNYTISVSDGINLYSSPLIIMH